MLIYNATVINENQRYVGSVVICDEKITDILVGEITPEEIAKHKESINAQGMLLLPGVIDTHVHFREPGLTHKADIASESQAAVAGGITSYMEMPNTVPQTTTIELLEEKFALAAKKSLANYSFFIGATNNNIDELRKVDPNTVCGVKLFMGSSTGNMLVDNTDGLEQLFAEIPLLIMAHCEDEDTIQRNIKHLKETVGENLDIEFHPQIRSTEACYISTKKAVDLAQKHNARLHIAHISTEKELKLLENQARGKKNITAEVCPHHLLFTEEDYASKGNRIKCNPAIKHKTDREALRQAAQSGVIDTIATDHAPHAWAEKHGNCLTASSGLPFIEWSLPTMLQMAKEGIFSYERVVEMMSHKPADIFRIKQRGYIRIGYFADLVLVSTDTPWTVTDHNTRSKCAWSPINDTTLVYRIDTTLVNGKIVFQGEKIDSTNKGKRLEFNA